MKKRHSPPGRAIFAALPAILAAFMFASADLEAAAIRPVELRCEHREDPSGIREAWPRLTWRLEALESGRRNLVQSAWQILVSSSPGKLAAGEGDIWDSGRVESSEVRTVFAGRKLAALQRAWWKVRAWDGEGGMSAWSEPAAWSRGLEDTWNLKDWPGAWIGLDAPDELRETSLSSEQRQRARTRQLKWMKAEMGELKKRPPPKFDTMAATPPTDADMVAGKPLTAWFRKSFYMAAKAPVKSAVIWLVPDMEAEIWMNGRRIETVARWEIARQIGIIPFLQEGENVLGLRITQADGYAPAACGEIEIKDSNGMTQRIPFDASWSFAESKPGAGWTVPDYNADNWKKAATKGSPPWGSWENATQWYPPVPFLRKEFSVGKKLQRATLCATAAGIYELELNGRKVGTEYFAPGWTDYFRRLHAQTHDVTDMLTEGKNAIGVILAEGWFAGNLGHVGKKWSYGGYPRARVMLVLEYEDGRIERVVSDRSWKGAHGPIRYADLYQGYGYDARLEMRGWSRAGFDDSKWARVQTGLRPIMDGGVPPLAQTVIEGATLDGVRVTEELRARSVRESSPGVWVVDFGQNFVGWVRMKTHGETGQHVLLRHAEMLNPNGTIYTSNLRGAAAADEFWLKGDGEETLEPKFTFHGFRYAEVRGLTKAPAVEDFTGVVAHTPMKRTGWFECSDARLNRLFENIIWGQRGNYLEIPTDCPQRDERLGWTGDVQFFARTASYNFDTRAFLERWLDTLIVDSQAADGSLPSVAPVVPSRRGLTSTAWGDAAILCTHALWWQYGEARGIERHFDAMARYMDWLERRTNDGIVLVGGYGDWLHKGGTAKTEVIDTAYHAHLCDLMAQMAEAIGRMAEAARYAELRDAVKAAFKREFLRNDGSIHESSQTGYALAFTMGLVPDELRAAMTKKFEESIKAFNWHLATGFIGTPRLMPALFAAGLDGTAWRVLMQDTYPSWLYQVKLGATTMWERWDGWTPEEGFQAIAMNSFNHYAFGAVGESFYRHIAGIDTDGPGFREIVIRPHTGGGLTFARAAYEAGTGRIESNWKIESDGRFFLDVKIPVNSRAKVYLPAKSAVSVTEGGRALGDVPGVRLIEASAPGRLVCEVGSGDYHFEVKP